MRQASGERRSVVEGVFLFVLYYVREMESKLYLDTSPLSTAAHLVTPRQAQCILILKRVLSRPLGAYVLLRFGKVERWWEVGHDKHFLCGY